MSRKIYPDTLDPTQTMFRVSRLEASDLFFSSDHHFGHAKIIEYTKRPYAAVDEMDADLIEKWNAVVPRDATTFYLGDLTLGNNAQKYLEQLNGDILILSNPWHHDARWLRGRASGLVCRTRTGFARLLPPMVVIEVSYPDSAHPVVLHLSHYPLEVWDRRHYGAIHLHGHSHGNLPLLPRRLDVGVDTPQVLQYSPRPYKDIEEMRP